MTVPKLMLAVCLLVPLAAAEKCDLAKVANGFLCESCDVVLDRKELVSDQVHYLCEECGAVAHEAGECSDCEVALTRSKSGKGVCGQCFEKPTAVQVCVKEYFECPECGDEQPRAGKCTECEVARVTRVSRSLVVFTCFECDSTALRDAKCTDDECEAMGKPLVRMCEQSGSFPHVALVAARASEDHDHDDEEDEHEKK